MDSGGRIDFYRAIMLLLIIIVFQILCFHRSPVALASLNLATNTGTDTFQFPYFQPKLDVLILLYRIWAALPQRCIQQISLTASTLAFALIAIHLRYHLAPASLWFSQSRLLSSFSKTIKWKTSILPQDSGGRIDFYRAIMLLIIIVFQDVLSLTKFELMNSLGLSNKETEELIKIVCQACAPSPVTALDIYNEKKKSLDNGFMPTSLSALDTALHGGLLLGNITEIVGPPSVGKTQLCMLLCIVAASPRFMQDINYSVIYIDSECTFMARRLKTMAISRFPKLYGTNTEVANLMQNIHVYQPATLSESKNIIQELESDVIRKKVKLIIIDSMAALLKKELGSKEKATVVECNNTLVEYAANLKNLAEAFGVVIFVTNQITTQITDLENSSLPFQAKDDTKFDDETNQSHSSIHEYSKILMNTEKQVIPTLGSIWAHCVNTRLMARFVNSSTRQLIIAKSPLVCNASMHYVITQSGIELADEKIANLHCSHLDGLNLFTKCDFT